MKRINYLGNDKKGLMISQRKFFSNIDIDSTLDHLCKKLPISNWVLAGGLASDLYFNRELRPRHDIDIVSPFQILSEGLQNEHYRLAIENFRIPYGVYLDFIEFPKKLKIDSILGKHLKFLSVDYLNGKSREFTDIIDVYCYSGGADTTTGFFPGNSREDLIDYETRSGKKIKYTGQDYVKKVKKFLNRKKDQTDLALFSTL